MRQLLVLVMRLGQQPDRQLRVCHVSLLEQRVPDVLRFCRALRLGRKTPPQHPGCLADVEGGADLLGTPCQDVFLVEVAESLSDGESGFEGLASLDRARGG